MALLSLITEQSTVPCVPTIRLFLGDHFGVDKKKSGDHFGVDLGIISVLGIISGLGSFRGRFGDHFRVGDHFGVDTPEQLFLLVTV